MRLLRVCACSGYFFISTPRLAHAERARITQDPLVLGLSNVRLEAGIGAVYQSEAAYRAAGTGLNLEETVGFGSDFEFGARFAARPDRTGQGTRADEFARGFDLDTFGTGLSVTANPEFRLGWRAFRWPNVPSVELGLEGRLVIPTTADPNTTGVLGVNARFHPIPSLRLDAGLRFALTSEKFYEQRLATSAAAAPLAIWLDPGRIGYLGLIQDLRHDFATRYTRGVTRWQLGAGIGSRFGAFDLLLACYLPDALGDQLHRVGAGLTLSSSW